MNGRKNQLPPTHKKELLGEPCRSETTRVERRKKKRFGLLFAITLCVGITTLLLPFSLIDTNSGASLADRIASAVISREFIDLSNDKKDEKNEHDDLYSSILDLINGIFIPSRSPDSTQITKDQSPAPPIFPDDLYAFDYDKVPIGEVPIIPMDLSLSGNGSAYVNNSTTKILDTTTMLNSKLDMLLPSVSAPQSAPQVLIIHTHGTESYSEEGAISFADDKGELARSENINENVVSLGAIIAETLDKKGIKTIHCTVMHDIPQYKDAYKRSAQTIKEYLKKYPSIKLVIDVHRDSILKSTGELVRPVTAIDGKAAAQLMMVVGGSDACLNWQKNLTLAIKLRDSLNSEYQNLCRPAYLKPSTYNQDLVPYSILLEVGASGNSLGEAKISAELFAKELSKLFSKI